MTGRRIPDDTREQIARAYLDDERSAADVAREYGVTARTVANCVHEAGELMRPAGRPPQPKVGIAYTGGWRQDGWIRRPRVNVRETDEEEGL